MQQEMKVMDAGTCNTGTNERFLTVMVNGNQIAKLSHDQAVTLASKLLAVACRLSNQA